MKLPELESVGHVGHLVFSLKLGPWLEALLALGSLSNQTMVSWAPQGQLILKSKLRQAESAVGGLANTKQPSPIFSFVSLWSL